MGEIIPFPVWIIPFPVLKMHFILLGKKCETSCKRSFLIEGPELGEIIPFPVWMIPLPFNYELLGENERHFVK